MRRNFGKIDEKVRHFEINNQSQPGRTEHDNQVENVAENEEGISNGEVADDVEQVDENPGEVETADDNQFVGVVSVGYHNRKRRQQSDKQDNHNRQRGQNGNQNADCQQNFLKQREPERNSRFAP